MNLRSTATHHHCYRNLGCTLLLVCCLSGGALQAADAGSIICIEPGGPKEGLPERAFASSRIATGLRLFFKTPGILQSTPDLLSGDWEGVAMVSPHFVPLEEMQGSRFYRVLSAERPVKIHVPASYEPEVPIPLVILLHGFTDTGQGLEDYTKILPLAEEHGFAYCYPDGTLNDNGHHFWNASPACCDFLNSGVDDVTYLRSLIEDARERINIDSKRVFLTGWSNGAFMAHRMAQEHSDLVAAIACLSGTISEGESSEPTQPVNVLEVHGTADEIVDYPGGTLRLVLPGGIVYQGATGFLGAQEVVNWWGTANVCANWVEDDEPTMELSTGLGDPDTTVGRYTVSPPGGEVELWSIQGGLHWPEPSDDMWRLMIEWLLDHPKP